LVTCRMCNGV